mmetsp:Transcript_4487/g.10169  ORF Transcript_4487/g.10169 Transcript_4487/m.10169 type:complete len:150 (+) Transcript_4487:91-540(+)
MLVDLVIIQHCQQNPYICHSSPMMPEDFQKALPSLQNLLTGWLELKAADDEYKRTMDCHNEHDDSGKFVTLWDVMVMAESPLGCKILPTPHDSLISCKIGALDSHAMTLLEVAEVKNHNRHLDESICHHGTARPSIPPLADSVVPGVLP